MRERVGDFVAASATLIFAILLYYGSLGLPDDGPEKMPQLIAIVLVVSATFLFIRAWRMTGEQAELFEDVNWAAFGWLIASWIATVLLLETIGFFFMLGLFTAWMNWLLLGRPTSARALAGVVLFGTGMTALLWLIFSITLKVNVPKGLLF